MGIAGGESGGIVAVVNMRSVPEQDVGQNE